MESFEALSRGCSYSSAYLLNLLLKFKVLVQVEILVFIIYYYQRLALSV